MSLSLDNKTIYEIFRGCRLCGSGGGYKMPIIPSVVGFDCADIDLRQKIRECVQIEVNQDDKMPPLICELCVDKVNDFYEFLAMCRDTNVKTRRRLGLPDLQTQNLSEADNCILGVTEPVYQHDEDDEPLQRNARPAKVKVKKEDKNDKNVKSLKKELENLIKQESSSRSSRSSRSTGSRAGGGRRSPTPSPSPPPLPLHTRQTRQADHPMVIEIDDDDDDDALLVQPGKRTRDRGNDDTPNKKLKLTIKLPPPELPPPPSKTKPRPGPKSSKREPSPALRPSRQAPSPAPGPKSSKPLPTPTPGPKSSKRSTSPSPGPKSSKLLPTPAPGPKSSKRSTSPAPGPKSSKLLPAPAPGPKSSKPSPSPISFKTPPSPSPGPKSKSSKIIPTPTLLPKTSRPGPKSSKRLSSPSPSPKSKPGKAPVVAAKGKQASPVSENTCKICESVFQSGQGYHNHVRSHTVKFTSNDLACNPCGEWFSTSDEATAHHKQHRSKNKPYTCPGCKENYRSLQAYSQHASEVTCVPWIEKPDEKCSKCWRLFPTRVTLSEHRCGGIDSRPGGKCSNCSKTYATLKTLKKHQSSCMSKKKGAAAGAAVPRRMRGARVEVARVDRLLAKDKRGRYNVAKLPQDFGLNPNCVYPYRAFVRVKQEPLAFDGMVSINKDVRDEFYIEEDYVHWDSDNSSSDEEFSLVNPMEKKKKVPSLTTLTLKTIYSKRCLGKVPRKLRKVRTDKFDSFFNPESEFDNVQNDINNIIDNLGDENDGNDTICSFSLSDIKLTDVKSISEVDNIGAGDSEVNGETNYESDSLLENESEAVANDDKVDSECVKMVNNEQTSLNIVNKHLMNPVLDNGSETDASTEDNTESHGASQYDDKDTASENSLNIELKDDTLNKDEKDTATENSHKESQGTKLDVDEKSTASESSLNIDTQGTKSNDDASVNSQNKILSNIENLQNGNSLTETRIENNYDVTENQTDLINEIDELYDKKLMDELDAQIDEKTNLSDKSDKILLDDLVPDKGVSLSLDNISDEEFNFDA